MKTMIKSRVMLNAFYTAIAVITSVALPQICHIIGGDSLGSILLPMHIPVFVLGLSCGTLPAVLAGAISPVLSFALTGMPKPAMLAFMVIELAVYGAVCGFFKDKKMHTTFKVMIAQVIGRLMRAVAIITAFYAFNSTISPQIIFTSVATGIFGIAIQWLLIPVLVKKRG